VNQLALVQHNLHDRYVAPLAKLATDLALDSNKLKAARGV
jgi:hypothetical protein